MQKIIKQQSNVFLCISTIVLLFAFGVDLAQSTDLIIALLMIVLIFGVPHGSLDVLFAQQTYQLNRLNKWIKFLTLYSLLALFIIATWILAAYLVFYTFLLLSALHFSDDLQQKINRTDKLSLKLIKYFYGLSIIVLPSYFFYDELIRLYSMLVLPNYAKNIVDIFYLLSLPLLMSLLGLTLFEKTLSLRSKLEIFMVCLISISLHPILSFTVYFCLMHSARHILRSKQFLSSTNLYSFVLAMIIPTIAVLIIGWLVFDHIMSGNLQLDLIKIIFVGLAALTLPHALILKKSNFYSSIK